MGWFRRSTGNASGGGRGPSLLPGDAVELLSEYGRFRYDATSYTPRRGLRCGVEDPEFYLSFSRAHERDPSRFVAELAAAVAGRNDWATVGGSRLVQEELTADEQDPNYLLLADSAVAFFYLRGDQEFAHLTGHERQHWASREAAVVARAETLG